MRFCDCPLLAAAASRAFARALRAQRKFAAIIGDDDSKIHEIGAHLRAHANSSCRNATSKILLCGDLQKSSRVFVGSVAALSLDQHCRRLWGLRGGASIAQ